MIGVLSQALNDFRAKNNVYLALLKSFALCMLFYSIARVIFYLLNTDFFPDMTLGRFARIMAGGTRFDLTAALYSNSLFILLLILPVKFRFNRFFKKSVRSLFIIVNAIAIAMNMADSVYYPFTLRRTTLSVLDQFGNEQNMGNLLLQFLVDYWYAVLIWLVLVYVFAKIFQLIDWEGPQQKNNWVFYVGGLILFPGFIYLFIGGARGGFAHSTRPITLSNAAEYAAVPKDINLVLNTPFAVMRTATANVIQRVNYFPNHKDLGDVFDPVKVPTDSVPFTPKNVVIIILESFSKEFVGAYHRNWKPEGYRGYTPFLDSLIDKSWAFQYSMANGRKSIDAMPSVIASIPSIEVPYVLSHYSGNKINSLANLLKPKGYYSAFFHGAPNGSMGFQAFANLCGFDQYYGKDEYDNDEDFDGIWGVWDDPFFQFYARQMNSFREPFFTTLFSVSSHHPYNLPEQMQSRFQGGPKPIHKTIQYTDYALEHFFKTASRMPWFKNTLFVITADHASAEIGYPEYNTPWGYFSIPVFFFDPSQPTGSFSESIIQQVDILPTILSTLHYDRPFVAFGRNVLGPKETEPFAFNYLDNLYQFFWGDYLLRFDGTKTIGLFDFKKDKLLQTDLQTQLPELRKTMETKVKAFIQQYNNRMVDDNLTVEGKQSPVSGR
jgi:phosphoglycerol transferase MdoB-like AlkP superfamily enzyme